ncbi:MAG: hypothetical protein AABY16_01255 [Nanoarchaeota archaeon]
MRLFQYGLLGGLLIALFIIVSFDIKISSANDEEYKKIFDQNKKIDDTEITIIS